MKLIDDSISIEYSYKEFTYTLEWELEYWTMENLVLRLANVFPIFPVDLCFHDEIPLIHYE